MTKIEMVRRIDKRLMEYLPDLIYEELKYIRKNDDVNKESDELQEFLWKDYHDEYYNLSPLMYQLNKVLDNLYSETPYEKYRD
jgi:DNA integrity scanning protein DisA with diadenylate cyclase activity